jgi:hypothetical protein
VLRGKQKIFLQITFILFLSTQRYFQQAEFTVQDLSVAIYIPRCNKIGENFPGLKVPRQFPFILLVRVGLIEGKALGNDDGEKR